MKVGRSWIEENTWLSEREAEAFEKYYIDDKRVSDIADEMSIEMNTVSTMLKRIRNKAEKSKNTIEIYEEATEE